MQQSALVSSGNCAGAYGYCKTRYSTAKTGPVYRFQSEGAKIVLYIVSPRGTSMVEARGENFAFLFSRTLENAYLDTFSMSFVFVPQMFLCLAGKWRGHGPLLGGERLCKQDKY